MTHGQALLRKSSQNAKDGFGNLRFAICKFASLSVLADVWADLREIGELARCLLRSFGTGDQHAQNCKIHAIGQLHPDGRLRDHAHP